MQKFTLSIALLAATACSAAPTESTEGDLSTGRFSLRSETATTTDPWACNETGIFYDADGNVIVCYAGGVRVAAGDVNGDGTTELLVSSLKKAALPDTHVIPEGAAARQEGGGLWVEGAAAVAIAPDGVPVPAGVDVAPDCDGMLIDPETGDILICTEAVALLLPAVQSAREAATRTSKKGGGGSSKMEYGGAYLAGRGGAGLDILIGGPGSTAMQGGGGDDVIFGGLGQDYNLDGACLVETTTDGLGVLSGCSAMAAKTKADILIESLGNL